jgi:hypothetical protein
VASQFATFGIDKGRPAQSPKVPGSVYVGMVGVTTREFALRGAIGSCRISTLRASTVGVPRLHNHNPDASLLRFVLHKRSQLPERPVMQSGSLLASNRHPRANALDVLQLDCSFRALRFRHQPFRYYVGDILGETLSLPESFFSLRFADFVPILCSFRRNLRCRCRTRFTAEPQYRFPSESVATFAMPKGYAQNVGDVFRRRRRRYENGFPVTAD